MKDTSCGCNCPFVKQGFCEKVNECPNYIESWWIEGDGKEPTIIKDCSPKRMLLQQQLLQSRLDNVLKALCESRDENSKLLAYLHSIIESVKSSQKKEMIPYDYHRKPDYFLEQKNERDIHESLHKYRPMCCDSEFTAD